jgi:hypothetical protein
MEPFIDLTFDGPQEDDIIGANRMNGDRLEHPAGNEAIPTASFLGALGHGSVSATQTLSVDGTADTDWFFFNAPASSEMTLVLLPTGTTYRDGDQGASCPAAGTEPLFDALNQRDLQFEVRGPDGVAVLASVNAGGLGTAEAVAGLDLIHGAGNYYVRVDGVGGANVAQMYDLLISIAAAPLPVLTCPPDATSECGVSTAFNFNVGDPNGEAVTVDFRVDGNLFATHVFPAGAAPSAGVITVDFTLDVGVHTIEATATNTSGGQAICSFTVTTTDTRPPTITCPANVTVECNSHMGTVVTYTDPAIGDLCDPGVTVTCVPPSGSTFPLGTTTVNCTARDASGNTASCSFDVIVQDTTPPDVTAFIGRRLLWTATRGLLDTQLQYSATDVCDPAPVIRVTVWSDEDNGLAPFSPDGTVVGASLKLRAERNITQDGRVYLIAVTATDASGNVGFATQSAIAPLNLTVNHTNGLFAAAAAAELFYAGGRLPPPAFPLIVGPVVLP